MARAQRRPSAIEQKTNQALNQLGKDWSTLTWNQDRAKLGPLPIFAWNMLAVLAFGVLIWLGTPPRLWTVCGLLLFLLWTVARAGSVMPRRRKTLQDIYAAVRERAGLPRGTAANPPRPEGHISVAEWGKNCRAADFTVTLSPDAKAALAQPFHQLAEKSVQKSVPTPASGQEWVFEWADETHMRCKAVDRENPNVFIRNHDRKMVNALCDKALFDGARNAETHEFALSVDDRKESERGGTVYHFPAKGTFHYGGFDADDPLFRERVTSTFDAKIPGPGVWIYDWSTDGELGFELVDDNDVRARRKKELSKIIADAYTLLGNKRGMRLDVEVPKWMPEGKTHPPHFPTRLRIDFGTLNLGDRRDRDRFEEGFDTAMGARYKGLVWLYDWQPGAATILEVMAVPESSKKARRKDTEKTLRNVIESKFGSSKNFVDCDILEWQPNLTEDGVALVQTAEVKFGAVDVTSNEMRDKFQGHWDSLTTDNDWHYAWDSAKGKVTITAVPPIPDAIHFPDPGTPDFDEAIERAKRGILRFGPQKGGGWLEWDMNDTPHGLVGGKTGSGKSVALSIVLFYAMYLPDLYEVIVCDPKMMDFIWTAEFPNIVKVATTDVELCEACGTTRQELEKRQELLKRVQVRKLSMMRGLYRDNPELERAHGPVPKRLILFFDEIADFLAPGSDEDIEELKKNARADLEKIGRLGRAMEVNIVAAAQKPDAKIVSTQLRSQLGFRLGVGPLDQYESEQILGSNHGTRFPASGTPKGRAWGYDPKNGYRQVQIMFLPDDSMTAEWDPTQTLLGTKDRIRTRLDELGFHQVQITNNAGGQEPRWVTMDDDAEGATVVEGAIEAPDNEPYSEDEDAVSDPETVEGDAPAPPGDDSPEPERARPAPPPRRP